MFESPRSLWQHFAVAIVAVLVIMSLSSVNANNENDQCMLSGKTRTEKPCTVRLYQLSEALSRVAGLPVKSHVCLQRLFPHFRFILKSNINTENGGTRICLNERLSCTIAANFLEILAPVHTWRFNVSCFEVLDANKVRF